MRAEWLWRNVHHPELSSKDTRIRGNSLLMFRGSEIVRSYDIDHDLDNHGREDVFCRFLPLRADLSRGGEQVTKGSNGYLHPRENGSALRWKPSCLSAAFADARAGRTPVRQQGVLLAIQFDFFVPLFCRKNNGQFLPETDQTTTGKRLRKTLEQCEKDKERVLVHCMSGKNRSPAIVIAYLMKSKGWRLAQSYQWVKERRPSVELTEGVYKQLQEYEQKLYGSVDGGGSLLPGFSPTATPSLSFGFPKINDSAPLPTFSSGGTPSIFSRAPLNIAPTEFTFGAGQTQKSVTGSPFNANPPNPNVTDIQMDGS
ncbi:Tyrosine specific protein phosphatases domain [Sesbania bispinosa]|nr:Tyrosine specific protein phosphatases domain [Sesbania bispinosa]